MPNFFFAPQAGAAKFHAWTCAFGGKSSGISGRRHYAPEINRIG